MKKAASIAGVVLLAFGLLLCGCSVSEFDPAAFEDGKPVPALDRSQVESITVTNSTGSGRISELNEGEIDEFLKLYQRATVKMIDGGTTPDFQVCIRLKNGSLLILQDNNSKERLEVQFRTPDGNYGGLMRPYDTKIVSAELVSFILNEKERGTREENALTQESGTGKETNHDPTTEKTDEAEPTAESDPERYTAEIKDLGGHEFVFLRYHDWQGDLLVGYYYTTWGEKKINPDFRRYGEFTQRYHCTYEEMRFMSVSEVAEEPLSAGEYAWDVLYAPISELQPLAEAGLLVDLAAVKNLDLNKIWWDRERTAALSVNGGVYLAVRADGVGEEGPLYAYAIPKSVEAMLDGHVGFPSAAEKVAYFLEAFCYQIYQSERGFQ